MTLKDTIKGAPSNNHQQITFFKKLWLLRGDMILVIIFLLITALYALLMVQNQVPIVGFVILAAAGLLFWALTGRLSFSSPMDVPILGLILLLPLTIMATVDRSLTLPNLYGLTLGIALFYVIINWVRFTRRLPLVITALIVLALAIAILGLVGTDWKTGRLQVFNTIYDLLPNWVAGIPGGLEGVGINANSLGGVLVFFPPLFLSLLLDQGSFERMCLDSVSRGKTTWHRLYKLALVIALVTVTFTLVLTQSRGAYLGTAAGIFALLVWKDRRFLWLIPIVVVGFILWQATSGWSLDAIASTLDLRQESTLGSRLILWRDTVYILQDFPVTGVGLNAFNPVRNGLYRFMVFENKDPLYFHAHNTFLAVAVEMGLPALILYVSMLSSFGWMAWRVHKKGRSFTKALVIGLTCGLGAHQVFGIMDAYTLGKKLGVVMWIFFGLMTALFIHRHNFSRSAVKGMQWYALEEKAKSQKGSAGKQILFTLMGLILWSLLSVLIVSLVNINPYLSLVSAIGGGIILGVVVTYRFWLKNNKSYKSKVKIS